MYLQRGPFPQSTIEPNRGEYDLECQSVAVATEELFSEQGVDKKVKDLEKKRKAMRAKGLFIGEAAVRWKESYKHLGLLRSRHVPESAALSHIDSIQALRYHPKDHLTDSYYTGLVKDRNGNLLETDHLCTDWVHRSFKSEATKAVEQLGKCITKEDTGGFFGPSTGLSPLDGADTTSSKNSFTTYKHLKMDVKTFTCVKLLYIFQGRKAPRNPPAKAKKRWYCSAADGNNKSVN